jgi:hypothetical protein
MMTNGSCGACAFFDDHKAAAAQAEHAGLCRFNPPVSQPAPEAHGLWPVVSDNDWCGHFAPETTTGAVAAE